MIVLHAGWKEGALHLWGESESNPVSRRGKAPGRGRRYGSTAGDLARSILHAPIAVAIDPRDARDAVAWLPSARGKVIPSSPLIGERRDPSPGRISFVPRTVAAAPLSTDDAIVLLCSCMGKRILAPGVILGKDLLWWADLLRFAGALVARQEYIPGMAQEGHAGWAARWEPAPAAAGVEMLAVLAGRMPIAARALCSKGEAPDPSSISSLKICRQATAVFLDHMVRTAASDVIPPALVARRRSFDSIHDAWIHSLSSDDPTMHGSDAELSDLAASIEEWRRPIAVRSVVPIRLCFRLEEPQPDAGGDGWFLRFLLQPLDDPSLLLPLDAAWNTGGNVATLLARYGGTSRESILAFLGQAAGIDPQIAMGLDTADVPAGVPLDAAGAHMFLTRTAAALEEGGFGVFLPAWWTERGTKTHLTIRGRIRSPKLQARGQFSLDEILHFDWEVALGEMTLELQELDALAALKAPLLRIRGQWVELNADEIAQAVAVWRRKGGDRATARDAIRIALGAKDPPGGFELASVEASGWIGDLIAAVQGEGAYEEVPSPARFVGTLRPYQVRGLSWLSFLRRWGLGGCLADDMGLGKTIQALALIQREWDHEWDSARGSAKAHRKPTLIVCPTSVVNNWKREAERFTPSLPVMVHHGSDRKRGEAFLREASRQAIVISSYGLLQRDLDILKGVPWVGVILDEAQNIKNPETNQARCARQIPAGFRFTLTGTPIENSVADLWSIMEFLNPGLLGTQAEFKRRFFVPIQAARDTRAADRLRRIVQPFLLRRAKSDREVISDLPEKQEMKVFCTLTREQASLYSAVVKDAEGKISGARGITRRGVILATLTRLKQVCNHPAQFLKDRSAIPGRSGKLARLTEMLEETIAVGDRALVFTQFAEMGEILRRHCEAVFGREVLFLHGGVPRGQRDRMVDRFQSEDGDAPPVFVLSLKAGGIGLNLTRANHVFHFDRWWNPAVEMQATDRAFRIGQVKNVQVHKFVCAGTLEEKIDAMIASKVEIAEQVVGTGEGWLTELSNAELRRIFTLRPEAVGE